jgi:hypothetical protein
MQEIVAQQPEVAWAVSCMTLYDQLELMLKLLKCEGNTYLDDEPDEPLALNVVRLRLRRLASDDSGSAASRLALVQAAPGATFAFGPASMA